ncbi:MAG: hypothetical protein K0R78_3530 [Pelosinus sp.]|nr:hypothetical protein [Pelosinus sp.]
MHQKVVRTALLLALMIVLQSLRLLVPVPPFISMFVVGSAINACLLIALEITGPKAALGMAVLAPIVAFFQQALPLPIFILPVAFTNMAYVLIYHMTLSYNRWLAITLSSIGRMLILYFSSSWAFSIVALPEKQATILKALMSWPQLVTGIIGGILCMLLLKRLASTINRST